MLGTTIVYYSWYCTSLNVMLLMQWSLSTNQSNAALCPDCWKLEFILASSYILNNTDNNKTKHRKAVQFQTACAVDPQCMQWDIVLHSDMKSIPRFTLQYEIFANVLNDKIGPPNKIHK